MDTIAVQFQYPLDSALPAHVPSFDSSLHALLDSAMTLHHAHGVSDTLPALQLLMPVELGQPLPRIMILSSLFPCLLVLYLAVVAFNRFHSVPISVTSGKKMTDRLLPQLFLSDRTIMDEWTRWMRFVALCVGFALCAERSCLKKQKNETDRPGSLEAYYKWIYGKECMKGQRNSIILKKCRRLSMLIMLSVH